MPTTVKELRHNISPEVKFREPTAPFTNFKIGGPARFFFEAKTTQEVIRAVQVAHELHVSLLVLGGGSNVLVSDKGWPGLMVVVRSSQLNIEGTRVTAEAGVRLAYMVQQSVAAGLTGLEPLVAVPGTVGGAVVGNAGVPQTERGCIGDWVKEVSVLRGDSILAVPRSECGFGYRESAFKQNGDVVLSAVLELERGEAGKSQELIRKFIDARKSQPYDQPSSGCVFKNAPVTNPDELRDKFKGEEKLEGFIAKGQLPASWLIDRAGLKGKTMGKIQVSERHANYMVNLGGGTAEQVVQLVSFVKQQVRDKYGIQLQEEVRYVGF